MKKIEANQKDTDLSRIDGIDETIYPNYDYYRLKIVLFLLKSLKSEI